MTKATETFDPDTPIQTKDGFDVLDACHRQTLFTLGKLAALVSRLTRQGEADEEARSMASEIHRFFSTTARQHHEDEERHIFPALAERADADLQQAIARLLQDHHWLEADWGELSLQLEAIASGQSWWDIDSLRDGSEIFTALSHDHIALEESFIYPQARQRMPDSGRETMSREMAARRHKQTTPD